MERKFIAVCRLHHAKFFPFIFHRILPLAMQDIRTDVPDVIFIPGCIVDIPSAKQIVNLRCPDMDALRSAFMSHPEGFLLRMYQTTQIVRSTQNNPVISRYGCGKIAGSVRVAVHKRIRPLRDPFIVVWRVDIIVFIHFYPLFLLK